MRKDVVRRSFTIFPLFIALLVPGLLLFSTTAAADQPLAEVELKVMPLLDNEALLERDVEADSTSPDSLRPIQSAEPVEVAFNTFSDGTWEVLPDGSHLWRLRIRSEGASSMAVTLIGFSPPPSAEILVYSPDKHYMRGPFTQVNAKSSGNLWIPKVAGPELVVEARVSAEEAADLIFQVATVHHGYRPIIWTPNSWCWPDCPGSAGCNIDTACIDDDPWGNVDSILPGGSEIWSIVKRSVGNLDIGNGECNCSGTLVNSTDAPDDKRLLFFTASHCFRDCHHGLNMGEMLDSVQVYWNFENSTCRDYTTGYDAELGNGFVHHVTGPGANRILEWSYSDTDDDFILLELDYDTHDLECLPAAFAGWNRVQTDAEEVVAIHHPIAAEKRVSFSSQGSENGEESEGTEQWMWLAGDDGAFEYGKVQPGSSGSPLFNEEGLVVGVAASAPSGGWVDCLGDPIDEDIYPGLAVAHGASYNRLKILWGDLGYSYPTSPDITLGEVTPVQNVSNAPNLSA